MIHKVSTLATQVNGAVQPSRGENFRAVFDGARGVQPVGPRAPGPSSAPPSASATAHGGAPAALAARLAGQVAEAQRRLDQVLKLAASGRTFTPAELIALQAHAYRASQEIDLASKVVEKATSAVKQTLQTQV